MARPFEPMDSADGLVSFIHRETGQRYSAALATFVSEGLRQPTTSRPPEPRAQFAQPRRPAAAAVAAGSFRLQRGPSPQLPHPSLPGSRRSRRPPSSLLPAAAVAAGEVVPAGFAPTQEFYPLYASSRGVGIRIFSTDLRDPVRPDDVDDEALVTVAVPPQTLDCRRAAVPRPVQARRRLGGGGGAGVFVCRGL